jgi:hypothetical protein
MNEQRGTRQRNIAEKGAQRQWLRGSWAHKKFLLIWERSGK